MLAGRALRGSLRAVILSDAANEADDAFALAHALLTPSLDVRGIVAQHFGAAGSVERSLAEAREVVSLCGAGTPVVPGASGPLETLDAEKGAGVDLILREARSADERPLFLLCMGPLTDLALALRVCPELATRATAVWVGGGRYPAGSHEANLARDLVAAREVFSSLLPLWQVPSEAYKTLAVPMAQLAERVAPAGALGAHLYQQLVSFRDANMPTRAWINPESWVLGDQAAVGVLLAEQKECYEERPAPRIGDDCSYLPPADGQRTVRVYHRLNDRLVLDDLFSKLSLFARHERRPS